MTTQEMLTNIEGMLLADAFPKPMRMIALLAGEHVARNLSQRQWTERFSLLVEGDTVLIPARLHFEIGCVDLAIPAQPWLLTRALETRSNDGFHRQRAAKDLMADLHTWAAPFIVLLIGEYIIEILEDIDAALTPESEQTLAAFIVSNPMFWETTKQRVGSYWNVYYRHTYGSETRRVYPRNEYVGFKLIDRLGMAVSRLVKHRVE